MALLFPLLAGLLLLCLLAVYRHIVYPAFSSPLSKIPNAHPTAPFSEAWILWQRYKMRNNRITLAAHLKHGPIVRLGPSELSVNCVDGGIRTIYAGGFEKHDWYPRLFPSYGVINMFSTTSHGEHSARKRILSNVYSKSFLQSSAQVEENSRTLLKDHFLPLIERAAVEGRIVDVHEMNNAFTMDFMSAYQFGLPSSTRFAEDKTTRRHHLHLYHCRKDYEYFSQEVPRLKTLMKWLGFNLVPSFCDDANGEIEDSMLETCNKADAYLGEVSTPGAEPVVYKQFKNGLAKQREKGSGKPASGELDFQRREVASEMLDHLGAGHETSAIALTYMYWELSRRPELQRELKEEVLTLSPPLLWPSEAAKPFELPHPKSIDSLPLLHAIVMETLRLHAPIPGMQPRITPNGGCTLAGYESIPGDVRVSAMPYTLHRNTSVFPDPETWDHTRWLKPDDSPELKEMLRWFWAFGSGGRMCIGSNLAMQEMKLIVASIYSNYTTTIVNDEGIEEIDAYTIKPTRNALDVRFEHT